MPRQSGAERLQHSGLITVFLISLQACAILPNAEREMAEPHAAQIQFEGRQGAVSVARSDAILAALEGQGADSEVLQKHLAYEQAVNTGSPLVLGNKVTLLHNGPATYAAMFAAIRNARDHINFETYIIADDDTGKKFSDLLLERQAAGVQVNFIYDSIGGLDTPQSFFDRLRDGGIKVLEFNPVNPLVGNKADWLLNNRDHRKLLVIDGRIAFTGGVNISDTYHASPSRLFGSRKHRQADDPDAGWRDTHVRIEGPVVAEFQKLFIGTWFRQKGSNLPARNYFPKPEAKGYAVVRAIGSTPDDEQSQIYLTLISAISHAESKVLITSAYFAPDSQLLTALTEAAQRGVEVKLVLPSYSDSGAVFHLGRSSYTQLLRGGVRIFERIGAVMHAKTVCIDGVWSTIGSTNLDWRSFLHNDEINAVILGQTFATQMEILFADDITQSRQITLEQWHQRSLLMRIKEQAARIAAYWL